MAQNAPITVSDGTVNHVFSPTGIKEGRIATYANMVESMIAGRETLVISHKDGSTIREVVLTTRVPKVVTETVDGVARKKVENFGSVSTKYLIPPTWEPEDIAKLRVIHAATQGATTVVDLTEDNAFVW